FLSVVCLVNVSIEDSSCICIGNLALLPRHQHPMEPPTAGLFLLLLLPLVLGSSAAACYSTIFSFGDSLADTGNLIRVLGHADCQAGRPPYGMTYFHRPTGRFSDGRLIVDFIGTNAFFFRPSSALSATGWVHEETSCGCSGGDGAAAAAAVPRRVESRRAEEGGELRDPVVPAITALPLLLSHRFAVPFAPPPDRAEDYDAIGCLRWLNEFSQYHNGQLHDELRRLQAVHPEVVIIYADYYRAMMNIFSNPDGFGIKERFLACCGGGGPYNYNSSRPCGSEGQTVCDDTWTYLHWDGLHMTEATYGIVSVGLLQGPFATPAIATTCPATRFSLTHPSSSSS
ncbi:hypothetical protein GW17_00002957, partial [Ensete ventricosum]